MGPPSLSDFFTQNLKNQKKRQKIFKNKSEKCCVYKQFRWKRKARQISQCKLPKSIMIPRIFNNQFSNFYHKFIIHKSNINSDIFQKCFQTIFRSQEYFRNKFRDIFRLRKYFRNYFRNISEINYFHESAHSQRTPITNVQITDGRSYISMP